MAKIKILTSYYGKRFQANAFGGWKNIDLYIFKDGEWEIEIEKTHPCFNGLKIDDLNNKDYYDKDNLTWKKVWELEFDSEAGYRPDKHEEKRRQFGKDGHITIAYKRERERERDESNNYGAELLN